MFPQFRTCSKPKPDGMRALTNDNFMDSGEYPSQLPVLTPVEDMLIAQVNPVLVMYKVQGHQAGYSEHIINFPQDFNEIARKLPRLPADTLHNIVVVKRTTKVAIKEFM